MTIRPEAVRAAELAARDVFEMWRWAKLDHNESREFFTGILAAAAPYMLAADRAAEDRLLAMVWNEGAMAALANPSARLVNPYRSAK